jgi:hypothetical protein
LKIIDYLLLFSSFGPGTDNQVVAAAALAVGRFAYHVESIPHLIEQGSDYLRRHLFFYLSSV